MAGEEHVSVAVRDDFVARQTKAKPAPALAELLWNSLDGDATEVSVEFAHNDLAGGMSKIVVYDNGDGFSRSDARALFGSLGGSWKRHLRQTKRNNRMIHGQEGRGRYKAFALGQSVTWKVCYDDATGRKAFEVRLMAVDLTDVTITEEVPAPERQTGVTVEINDLRRDFRTFESEEGFQELNEIFALYLMNYRSVTISIAGRRLDPDTVVASHYKATLPMIETADGTQHDAELEVIEWRTDARRVLYLCSASGFPFDQVETRFHIPGFSFSAYLKSSYVEELHNEERIALSEMDPHLSAAVEKARGIIDLMFSRSTRRHRANDIEHMIVELKAPKVKIGSDEVTQAKKYAIAVTSDERFSTVDGVRWHFWLVSNAYDEFARQEIENGPDRERRLIARGPRHVVGIKTWGELIEENRARLQFFQEHLQHSADEGTAIRYLQERHSQFLEGVIVEEIGENDGIQPPALASGDIGEELSRN